MEGKEEGILDAGKKRSFRKLEKKQLRRGPRKRPGRAETLREELWRRGNFLRFLIQEALTKEKGV